MTTKEAPMETRDDRGAPGAERGDSDAARKRLAAPADDSSPAGDTDQHSSADA